MVSYRYAYGRPRLRARKRGEGGLVTQEVGLTNQLSACSASRRIRRSRLGRGNRGFATGGVVNLRDGVVEAGPELELPKAKVAR